MELYATPHNHAISLPYYYYYYHLCRYYSSSLLLPPPHNYVHWSQTSDSHLYSANLPGVRKEDIKVEVEDSRYLIIRTNDEDSHANDIGRMKFTRKFRLPKMVDVDAISASYEDGVLTVRVPRAPPSVEPVTAAEEGNSVARAA